MRTVDWSSLGENSLYNVNGQNYLLQNKHLAPVYGDASQYGTAKNLPYTLEEINVNGGGILPDQFAIYNNGLKPVEVGMPGMQGKINYYQDASGNLFNDPKGTIAVGKPQTGWTIYGVQTLSQALNDSTTPRVNFQYANGEAIQGSGTEISGTQALADQAAARVNPQEKGLPLSAYGNTPSQQNTPSQTSSDAFKIASVGSGGTTKTIPNPSINTSAIPFSSSMTEKQKAGVSSLVASDRAFSETDAKNYAYATGQTNWSQFVGKTGSQILSEMSQATAAKGSPAGGTSYLVKTGDTLGAIASKFGTTVQALLSANPDIKNSNLIYKDQKIIVPEIGAKSDPNAEIKKIQEDIKASADNSSKTETASLFKDLAGDPTDKAPEFKIPSQLDTYNSLINAPAITEEKSKLADLDKKIKDIDLQESQLEADIRKEIEGEAPTSLIMALTAEKAKALYPKKQALLNERDALQTKLTNDLENAKTQFQLKVADQAAGLQYIQTLVSNGVTLTSEQMKLSDEALGYGAGFTKSLVETQKKALSAAKEKDQVDVMSKIIDLQTKLPEGKSFVINGTTYTSMTDPTKDIQVFTEKDASGNNVIIEYNKKTKAVTVTKTGVNSGGGEGGGSSENPQLYSGLSTKTASAVRAKVSAFKSEPIVTNFNTINEGYNFAKSLSATTKNPADDQALIYSLAKALDPNSVVREGEYATAQKYSQSWIKAFGTGVEQALNGTGFLSADARKNIKSTIEQRYNTSKANYQNLYNEYSSGINDLTGRKDGNKFIVDYSGAFNTGTIGSYRVIDPNGKVHEFDTQQQADTFRKLLPTKSLNFESTSA